ncbi:uncharacterized protein [Malus domestica]|uniref:uncharacterized protein n=1 Tax=Malus domestica TaxID=3750 RepID=UPI0010AB378B|nr:uncharacterized protein LOC114825151 [Malus domestica]
MAALDVQDFLEGWKLVVKHLENVEDADLILQQVVFGFWRIWKCRNDLVFKGVTTEPRVAVELWHRHVEEFRTASDTSEWGTGALGSDRWDRVRGGRRVGSGEGGVRHGDGIVVGERREEVGLLLWQKPLFGTLKLNCDAAWKKATGEGGVGWVLRDFAGLPLLARGMGGERFGDAIMAEAEAIRRGLESVVGSEVWAGSTCLVVESDSKGLINMLNKETTVDVKLEVYIQDIWRMTCVFPVVRFCFTPRQCNRDAHSIAAYVVKHGGRFGWDELGPEFLFNILAEDANVMVRL